MAESQKQSTKDPREFNLEEHADQLARSVVDGLNKKFYPKPETAKERNDKRADAIAQEMVDGLNRLRQEKKAALNTKLPSSGLFEMDDKLFSVLWIGALFAIVAFPIFDLMVPLQLLAFGLWIWVMVLRLAS